MTYCAPFPGSAVTNWDERSLDCSVGEWGLDIGLPAGLAIKAPFDATVRATFEQPCCPGCAGNCYCWGCVHQGNCERVCLGYGPSGEAVAFGHLVPTVGIGQQVSCGQTIGIVQQDACGGPHTEFQYFPDGNFDSCSSAVDPTAYLHMLVAQSSPPSSPPPPPSGHKTGSSSSGSAAGAILPAMLLLGGGGALAWWELHRNPGLRRTVTGDLRSVTRSAAERTKRVF